MSLINRIALCNYSNADGEDSTGWNPRFRYEVLNFLGQSAVVNLANGGGKTTAANAVIGLLSRQPTLLSRAKEHAAPQKVGHWSHIQVELIEPLHGGTTSDMFTAIGEQVSGETWVFGMAMNKDSDSNDYYYYPGQLEDLAPGTRNDGKLTVTRNDVFREQAKRIKGLEWGVTRENWRSKIGQHIPVESLMGLAEFQLKGGSDKDAPIFKLAQVRKGRRLDELFFYEILAPELLHDVLDDDGGEESGNIDQALYHQIQEMVRTRHLLSDQKTKVDEMETAMQHLRDAAELGTAVRDAVTAYKDRRRDCALDIAVIDDLVRRRPIPGIPLVTLPSGKLGEVAAHLVVVPGESGPRITDRGLAVVLGIEPKRVNEKARRISREGRKVSQLIEIPCDLARATEQLGGHRNQTYTIQQATDLLRKHTDEDVLALFDDAVSWFDNKSDTNPYRHKLMEAQVDEDLAIKTVNEEGKRIEELQKESLKLSDARQQVQADQAALDQLKDSNLFTEQELQNPIATREKVIKEREDAQQSLSGFEQQYARLQEYIPEWEAYRDTFGDEKPKAVHEQLCEREKSARDSYEKNQASIRDAEQARSINQEKINTLDKSVVLKEQKLKELRELRLRAKPILDSLKEDESPLGLEDRRRKELSNAEQDLQNCKSELSETERGIQAIAVFHELVPGADPTSWINETNLKREELTIKKSEGNEKRDDLVRRRAALDVDSVAADRVAQKALDFLIDDGIPHEILHNFILSLDLPEKRRRDILGMFSSLLFAPVININDEALHAVERLDQAELPVPVFLAKPLADFSRGCDLSVHEVVGRTGLIAGRITRQVECILDPSLVEREKEELDEKIGVLDNEISAITSELKKFDPEGDLVRASRAAKKAMDAGYPERVESLRTQFIELGEIVSHCEALLTKEMVDALRAAEDFSREGGTVAVDTLSEKLAKDREDYEEAKVKCEKFRELIEELRASAQEFNNALANAYPNDTKQTIRQAIRFTDLDGPDFLASAAVTKQSLIEEKNKASGRAKFELLFERAARWLEYQRTLESGDDIDEQIRKNSQTIGEAEELRKKAKERIDELKEELPLLRERVGAIDRAAMALITKYRRTAAVSRDYQDNGITEVDMENHPLGDVAWRLREAIENADTKVIDVAGEMETKAGESSIDTILDEIKHLHRKKEDLIRDFEKKTCEVAEIRGLAEVERDRLRNANGIDGAKWVEQFSSHYWRLFSEEKDKLEKLSADEKAVNNNFSERLSLLMEAASDNLTALRKVASKDPEGMISHFEVNAKVASREEMIGIIDRIVHEVDVYERRRKEDEEDNRLVDQARAQSDLQSGIRETLYHSVFSDVSVKYANNQIRPDGKAHRFSEALSTGQKNALLMMWVLRLAQYRIEREARKRITSLSRSRVRKQAQSIMIIDGLFSNLSEPKLIHSVMSSLTVTRGHFQLIGLVHDPKYQHDFNLFPVFLMGKTQDNQSWVSFDRVDESGALAFAKLLKRSAHDTA
ncbi:MAG: hypothetical protein AB2598_11005 [Candidatus Thiodiazotropha sp.]